MGFVKSLELDKPLEFNEGDVGLAGGIQEVEPASLHVVNEDRIYRYGGTCAVDAAWPEAEQRKQEDKDERLERIVRRSLRRLLKSKTMRGGGSSGRMSSKVLSGSSGGEEHSTSDRNRS